MENPYEILGINPSATPEEVKKAYFEMAKKYHPDSADETELRKFHEVAEAYKVLSDPDERKAFDMAEVARAATSEEAAPIASQHVPPSSERASYRDVELKTYHKNRFKRAIFRVVGTTLFVGLLGYFVSPILSGSGALGAIAGILLGFSLSMNRNFNVRSFFQTDHTHQAYRIFSWFMLLVGFGYFLWLIANEVFL